MIFVPDMQLVSAEFLRLFKQERRCLVVCILVLVDGFANNGGDLVIAWYRQV